MGDIRCAICGEPWDAYGVFHGDMTAEESKRFLKGLGCPCCPKDKPKVQTIENRIRQLGDLGENWDEDPLKYL